MDRAEFDKFAEEYSAQLTAASLKASGESPEYFQRYKVVDVARLVRDRLCQNADGTEAPKVLDFGCGVGNSAPWFAEQLPDAHYTGIDVSTKSLDVARNRHGEKADFVEFDGQTIPFEDNRLDVVFSACVFHHIDAEAHVPLMRELHRVLKPGGTIAIFEHNTRNPLTVRMVRDCPFDDNAVLIAPPEFRRRVGAAGFPGAKCVYRIFFPRRLSWLRPLERAMGWVPIGAQYYVTAQKAAAT